MVPFLYPKDYVPYYNRDPKRDHHFDNHPYVSMCVCVCACLHVGVYVCVSASSGFQVYRSLPKLTVPIIRIVVCWGLCWSPYSGKAPYTIHIYIYIYVMHIYDVALGV